MKVKGVNLGNWLVLEKWMSPALFAGTTAEDEYYLPRQLSKDVYEAAATGDKMAKEIFEYTGKMLGDAFADFVAFSSPQAIVLFGGLARSGELLLNPHREAIEKALMPVFRGKTKIILSELKESDAAVLGASALGWEAKYRAEVPISSVPTVAEVPASDESKEA